jgi:hypothetical protein
MSLGPYDSPRRGGAFSYERGTPVCNLVSSTPPPTPKPEPANTGGVPMPGDVQGVHAAHPHCRGERIPKPASDVKAYKLTKPLPSEEGTT